MWTEVTERKYITHKPTLMRGHNLKYQAFNLQFSSNKSLPRCVRCRITVASARSSFSMKGFSANFIGPLFA